jgi:hypothetical protein
VGRGAKRSKRAQDGIGIFGAGQGGETGDET